MRKCGECTACCEAIGVIELKKPAFVKCENQCAGGCSIYTSKPTECSTFECMWLDAPDERFLREEDRPDKCGIVFTYMGDRLDFDGFRKRHGYPPMQAFEAWAGAFESYRGRKVIERLRKRVIILGAPYADVLRRVLWAPDSFPMASAVRLLAQAEKNAAWEERERLAGRWKGLRADDIYGTAARLAAGC